MNQNLNCRWLTPPKSAVLYVKLYGPNPDIRIYADIVCLYAFIFKYTICLADG